MTSKAIKTLTVGQGVMGERYESIELAPRPYFVPYLRLALSPITLHLGKVPIHLVLTSPTTCLVSVPPRFSITDSACANGSGKLISVTTNIGTSFLVTYNGLECEVRLGRRITVLDADTYIHNRC